MEPAIRLAVIGGGPKAAALAAKAWVMNSKVPSSSPIFEVEVFEKTSIGANWMGGSGGYTDGEPPLCTHAERDVGFPYLSADPVVDSDMQSRFSWQAYLVDDRTYADWVNKGRAKPSHARFAAYLKWVFGRSEKKCVSAEVKELRVKDGRWEVLGKNNESGLYGLLGDNFDGVVITGPGEAKNIPLQGDGARPDNIFNGEDLWREESLDKVKKILSSVIDPEILIVGGGGTAAAAISWLVRHGYGGAVIQLVAPQPTLFSRSDNSFENLLFTKDDYWETLTQEIREETFFRLNRGVVWDSVIQDIRHANIVPSSGKAEFVERLSDGSAKVSCKLSNGDVSEFRPDLVIDGIGFNENWYISLLQNQVSFSDDQWKELRRGMGDGLELKGSIWGDRPPLHVPLQSSQIGPGYGGLMVLGAMSERILRFHLRRKAPSP